MPEPTPPPQVIQTKEGVDIPIDLLPSVNKKKEVVCPLAKEVTERITRARSWNEILEIWGSSGEVMDRIARLAALHRLSFFKTFDGYDIHCHALIRKMIAKDVRKFKQEEYSQFLLAISRIKNLPRDIVEESFEKVRTSRLTVHTWKPRHLSNFAMAYGNAGICALRLLRRVAGVVEDLAKNPVRRSVVPPPPKKKPEGPNDGLAVVDGSGQLRVVASVATPGKLRVVVPSVPTPGLDKFFGKNKRRPKLLPAEIRKKELSKMPMLPKDITNVCVGFVKAGADCPHMFKALAPVAIEQIEQFRADDLANLLWAYAKAGVKIRSIFKAAVDESLERFKDFSLEDLDLMNWSITAAGFRFTRFSKKVTDALDDI